MKNLLANDQLVKAASVAAIAYCASQAAVATVRVGQAITAGVKEFRNQDTETPSDQS